MENETVDSCISKSLSQHSLRGDMERPFCKLQLLARSELAAAV